MESLEHSDSQRAERISQTSADAHKSTYNVPIMRSSEGYTKPDPKELERHLHSLRRFHFAGHGAEFGVQSSSVGGYIPALLASYWNVSPVRYDYPLILYLDTAAQSPRCQSLDLFLRDQISGLAQARDGMRILADNIGRVERFVQKSLDRDQQLIPTLPLLLEAVGPLEAELQLSEENNRRLRGDFDALLARVPKDSYLLGFGDLAHFQLMGWVSHQVCLLRYTRFMGEVDSLKSQLERLLKIERTKDETSRYPEALSHSVGSALASEVNFGQLSRLLGKHRGTLQMSQERRKRIEGVLDVLNDFLCKFKPIPISLFCDSGHSDLTALPVAHWQINIFEQPVTKALGYFEQLAAEWAGLFRAVRIAHLEIEDGYVVGYHDIWFDQFDWSAFSREEVLLLPSVVVAQTLEGVAHSELHALTRLLLSGYPVHAMISQPSVRNFGVDADGDPLCGGHFELGYLGISQREALIHQTTAARPAHLLKGWSAALDTTRPSLHVFPTTERANLSPLQKWLYQGAMLEGRAHPLFLYEPDRGRSWAQCFEFGDNPQPDSDWPYSELACKDDREQDGSVSLSFTFADIALLDPSSHRHFYEIPDGIDEQLVVAVPDYLAMSAEQALRKIPYIWAVGADHRLRRLAISRALLLTCHQRLRFWHTLQELAGVHNEYVLQAIEREREQLTLAHQAELVTLHADYAAQLEQVRAQAVSEAMQRLASVLLQSDWHAGMIPSMTSFPMAGAEILSVAQDSMRDQAEAPVVAASVETEAAEDDALSFDDPWVDSILCTSCNDCIKINSRLFVYNEKKQARIGDASAGTYAELVRAAENCPARCIHTGKPLNPDEPNLAALLKRAKPYK
jgi:ferredoxin